MTRYSIPSETHPENIDTPINENYQPEVGLSDWEVQMAKLVGFEEDSPSIETQTGTEAEEDALNLPQSSSPSPAPKVSTKQPFSANPFAKLALVGTTTFALVLVAGAFLSQLMSASNQKPRKTNVVSLKKPQTTTETRLQQLEGEVETLKTKLALAEQAQAVKLAQQQLRTPKVTPRQPTSPDENSRNRPKIALQTTPTPTKTVYIPPKVVTRVVTVPQTPPQSPSPLPVVPTPETQPTVQFTPQPTPDPLQEWARLSKLGSYGQVLAVATPNNTNANRPTPEPVKNTQVPPQTTNFQSQDNTPKPPNSVVSQAQPNSPKSVRVGTSVKAVLATAVFGETSRATNNNNKDNTPQNVFVVRLKEPLKSIDGEVVLPENTELLTQVSSISEQGLVQLDVVKLVRENNGNLREEPLQPNSILIRASAGKPLIANQYKKGTSTTMIDAQQFVLGGIGKAAELFNRTESQVTTTSTGTVVTNSNPRRNLFAGILEGGVKTVVPQITQRNQQAISQAMQRTNIWFLPAGKEIEIYINQTVQL